MMHETPSLKPPRYSGVFEAFLFLVVLPDLLGLPLFLRL